MLYVSRADRKCARLVYGFVRNKAFDGLLDYGADVRFRRWGKIEATLRPRPVSLAGHRALARTDRVVTGAVNLISTLLRPLSPFRRLNGALTKYRQKYFDSLGARGGAPDFDEFVLECFSPDAEPVRLLLELWNGGTLAFRQAIPLQPGHNFIRLPADSILPVVDWSNARLTLYPENDAEVRLIFTWIDFVTYQSQPRQATEESAKAPAAKVKCVAWDLDNTLWRGVLVEDGPEELVLRDESVRLIRQLDERGILQTVVSKNDHDPAMAVLKEHELDEFFLSPAINWGAKSGNIEHVARQLNLGVDSFALIDDSAFERAEVQSVLPMVRVFAETQIGELLELPEFDVPVTEMSRARRHSYRVEVGREKARERFSGSYQEFLRSCELKLRVFSLDDEATALRCHELVQRSNQLNLSSRRYSKEEFEELLHSPGVLNLALHCTDRFGDYGIVGFVSIEEGGSSLRVTNFVLSCRVAQKQVEHAFFRWLAKRGAGSGIERLLADLVITERNGPLVAVFDEMGFRRTNGEGGRTVLELELSAVPSADSVVAVTVDLPE